ncbi:MAG: hypothetical protein P1T08_14060 [Acidimicrobiia bacterium]|nr:hypothetical protein [Acidimicrobiia bacterium]
MKKILIGSMAVIITAALALGGFALLGPDGALAQESDGSDTVTKYRFAPLDEVLDELVNEKVIDSSQADAIRERMSQKMPSGADRFHFRMEGFLDELPDGVTAPPGPPGTPEFDTWLEEMQGLLGEDFFGGHMFEFDGVIPEGGFPFGGRGHMGPGMMGEGFHQFHGFGDFNAEDLQGMIDQITEQFGVEVPPQMQDMIDRLREQLSDVEGAETSLGA